MKNWADKFFAKQSRYECLYLLIPFVLWVFCFRHFFTGRLWLEQDAVSYADQIRFYTDNLCKGVFPLWDPAWFSGAPYHFFLRRIGDVNPLLCVIVFLKAFGVSSATAYLVFLGLYYFLAGWAFYLIARLLFEDRFFAFSAYILFLFSSWGCEIFYNYIIIIFVPIIWFFYFLLSFARCPRKGAFLGGCLCTGIIVTTYIPFFFLTILALFTVLYIFFYGRDLLDFLKRGGTFFCKNRIFTLFCAVFLVSACIPALVFYKESKSGEFVMPSRHLGSDTSSAVAVGLDNIASGDIVSHGFFDRVFNDHAHLDMGDIFVPYVFFLVLLSATCARVNKLIIFLLLNILGLSLVTITSASGVHRFLYDHILFFKFIRNIYYFFWLAMFPMLVLLGVAAFKALLTAIHCSPKKTGWMAYILFCHAGFALFLKAQGGILWGGWLALVISLVYFWTYLFLKSKVSYRCGFCLFLLAVFIQSAQVYCFLDKKLVQVQLDSTRYDETHKNAPSEIKTQLYYASGWFTLLANYIDAAVLREYLTHPFIFYDNVFPCADTQEFFKTLQGAMAAKANIAYVSRFESTPNDWRNDAQAVSLADRDPVASGELSVTRSDVNTWKLKIHLPVSRFLVVNDNYNKDWHAFINGRETRLLRANVSFKGLWVPAGDPVIILRFSNPLRYGLHFFLIAFFVGVLVYLLVLLRKDKQSGDVCAS